MTPPTPAIIPSRINERSIVRVCSGQVAAIVELIASMAVSIQPIGYSPTVNTSQKVRYISTAKTGRPRALFVRTLSIVSETRIRPCAARRIVARHRPWM